MNQEEFKITIFPTLLYSITKAVCKATKYSTVKLQAFTHMSYLEAPVHCTDLALSTCSKKVTLKH